VTASVENSIARLQKKTYSSHFDNMQIENHELEKIISFELLKLKSDNSKCPVSKVKTAVAILTNSRLRNTVNWLQQKYLHVSPVMLE